METTICGWSLGFRLRECKREWTPLHDWGSREYTIHTYSLPTIVGRLKDAQATTTIVVPEEYVEKLKLCSLPLAVTRSWRGPHQTYRHMPGSDVFKQYLNPQGMGFWIPFTGLGPLFQLLGGSYQSCDSACLGPLGK